MKNYHIRNIRGLFIFLAAAAVIAAAGSAFAQSLSEGLWKEFVEGKTDEARIVYEHVANSSAEAQNVAKAKARLQALGENSKAAAPVSDGQAVSKEHVKKEKCGGPFILRIDPERLAGLFIKDEKIRKEFLDFLLHGIKEDMKRLAIEDLSSGKLPVVTICSLSGYLVPDDVDFIVESEENITFNAAAAKSSSLRGYNITPKVLFLSACPTAASVVSKYRGEYNLDCSSDEDIAAIVRFIRKEFPAPLFANVNYFEEFINGNKIKILKRDPLEDPMNYAVSVNINGNSVIIRSARGFKDFTEIVKILERNLKIKIDFATLTKTENGARLDISDISKLFVNLVPVFLKNYSAARETAKYNACMANLRCLSGAAELFAMETTEAKLIQPGDELTDTLVKLSYLKSKPKCPADGAYSLVKNGQTDFICTVHKTYWTKIEFRLAKMSGGMEKTLMNPAILASLDQDANISVGSEKNEKGSAKAGTANVAEGLKFFSVKVHPYRENEDYEKGTVKLSIDMTLTSDIPAKRNAAVKEAEGMVNFHASMRVKEDSGEWAAIPLEAGTLKDYRLYVRCGH